MNILITGAAGFIGANLATRLKSEGDQLFLVDRFSNYYSPELKRVRVSNLLENSNIAEVDLNQPESLEIFSNCGIETVVHLAGQPGIRVQYPDSVNYLKDNINGFNNALNWSLRNGVKRFLFASSSSVYETARSVPFNESETLEPPKNIYAFTKWINESVASSFRSQSSMTITGLRFFSVYGPHGRPDMAIHRLIHSAVSGGEFNLNGNGNIERDFTYIDDVTLRIQALIKANNLSEPVFNIGGGSSISMKSLIALIEEKSHKKIAINLRPENPADLKATLADNRKMNAFFGKSNWTSIEEGVTKTIEWHQLNNQN
jgi:UDP-glucuronate 4-epimerase